MSEPGGQPEPSWERLRIAPRPVRPPRELTQPTPAPEPAPLPPPPAPEPQIPRGPASKPDRSTMDPIVLDRSTARQIAREGRAAAKSKMRHRSVRKIDRVIQTALLVVLTVAVAGGVYWFLQKQLPKSVPVVQAAVPVAGFPTDGERGLAVLQAFLNAPDARAKSAYVLDSGRVLTLMEAAYGKGTLPEKQLIPGVPQQQEKGVLYIPSQVSGPPEFLLQLVMKESGGEYQLDWESYEQEMTQRFTGFATRPGSPAADFRLVLERVHGFEGGPAEAVYVRISTPGSPGLARPLIVHAQAAATAKAGLPWGRRRRALVRLEWEKPPSRPAEMVMKEIVRWEFLP